jgi:hypothetical protein
LSFYDPDCETVTSCMVYMMNILCPMVYVSDCLGGPKMLDDALM